MISHKWIMWLLLVSVFQELGTRGSQESMKIGVLAPLASGLPDTDRS